MGQYWIPVNLTKKEFVDPHKLGTGLKLWEQAANHPSTGAALIILCAAMPEMRGGGDFDLENDTQDYNAISSRTIGRWAGDRIALVGDYAEKTDLEPGDKADLIYTLCTHLEDIDTEDMIEFRKEHCLILNDFYTDISEDVAAVIEHELQGKFQGTGWREFVTEK